MAGKKQSPQITPLQGSTRGKDQNKPPIIRYDDEGNPEFDYQEERELQPEDMCIECGRESTDTCICGNPLCPMHFELGAGFCHSTDDKIHEKLCKEAYHSVPF